MDSLDTLIAGGVGAITTLLSWFLAKKKYYSEVDNTLIENMQKSLEFYKQLSDDNRERLDKLLESNEGLENEVKELKSKVSDLITRMCIDTKCPNRIK